ncbi:MAG: hypothetical protein LBO62_05160 [Endomicrobium sp.]|jgi:hypothetical protein|nr:hypothetical protein [Endomicrobium sp.]
MNSEELDEMFKKYREMPDNIVVAELRKEIDGFLSDAENIKQIILYPERYENGQQLREDYLWNIKLFYERSVLNKGFDISDKLLDVLYEVYKAEDTSQIQGLYARHIGAASLYDKEKEKEKKLLDIIEYNYERDLNRIKEISSAFEARQKENARLLRANRVISGVLAAHVDTVRGFTEKGQFYSDVLLEEIVDRETYGPVAAQIFESEYVSTNRKYSLAVLDRFLNAKQKKEYYSFLKTKVNLRKALEHITNEKLPYQIGIYHISRNVRMEVLYSIIKSKDIDPRFRLSALRTLSNLGQTEADIMFDKDNRDIVRKTMFSVMSNPYDDKSVNAKLANLKEAEKKYAIKRLFTEEELKEMAEISDRIIAVKKFLSVENPYSSSIAAEIFMTALIVKAAYYSPEKDKLDIIAALRELPFVLTFVSGDSYKGFEFSGEGKNVIIAQDAGLEFNYGVMRKYIEVISYPISQATKTASAAYRIIDALKNDEVMKNAARD